MQEAEITQSLSLQDRIPRNRLVLKDRHFTPNEINLSELDLTDITGIAHLQVNCNGTRVSLKFVPHLTLKLDMNQLATLLTRISVVAVSLFAQPVF